MGKHKLETVPMVTSFETKLVSTLAVAITITVAMINEQVETVISDSTNLNSVLEDTNKRFPSYHNGHYQYKYQAPVQGESSEDEVDNLLNTILDELNSSPIDDLDLDKLEFLEVIFQDYQNFIVAEAEKSQGKIIMNPATGEFCNTKFSGPCKNIPMVIGKKVLQVYVHPQNFAETGQSDQNAKQRFLFDSTDKFLRDRNISVGTANFINLFQAYSGYTKISDIIDDLDRVEAQTDLTSRFALMDKRELRLGVKNASPAFATIVKDRLFPCTWQLNGYPDMVNVDNAQYLLGLLAEADTLDHD